MRGFELSLARRLGWKAEGRKRLSPAVVVAVAGVALSVAVMIMALGVVLGFRHEVTAKVFDTNDAITLRAFTPGGEPRTFRPAEVLGAVSLPPGSVVETRNSVEGILKTPSDFQGISFQSRPDLRADSLIALSAAVAHKLGLEVGDRIPAYFVINDRIRTRALTVAEIYSTGLSAHDDVVAFCSDSLPRSLLGIEPGMVQAIGLRGIGADAIVPLSRNLHDQLLMAYYDGRLSGAYGIETIFDRDGSFFAWLDLLDTNVVVILVLMSLVAAFTLVASLFIIILERVGTIGLLKALGASNRQVRIIFMLMAERLVLAGLLAGNAIGLGLMAVQARWHLIPLDADSYFVDHVPVELSWGGILAVNVGAVLLSWLVLLLPAMIIARISPASTMRCD